VNKGASANFTQVVALTGDIIKRLHDSKDVRIYLFMHPKASTATRKQCEYPIFYTENNTSYFSITINGTEVQQKVLYSCLNNK